MIELSQVSYTYPDTERPVLNGLELSVPAGRIAAVVGANASGKSTLAKVVAGFIPLLDGGDLTGSVQLNGQPTDDLPLVDRVALAGLVIQNPFNQISGARYSVRGEIAFGLENTGVPREEMLPRIEQVAELLGITALLDRSPYALSGGQQQLVSIASMIIQRTPILVLDEPTSQLDPAGTRLVFEVLDQLRATGTTILIFEHKLELLHDHCDKLAVLAEGRIVTIGEPTEVLADPRCQQWGVGTTNYSQAARLAVSRGLRDDRLPIPVSLATATDYFGAES